MEISEIEKKLAAFKSTLQQPIPVPAAAVPTPVPEEIPPEIAPQEIPCFTKDFKGLIMGLKQDFIGQNNADALLIEFLGKVPECPVGA